MGKWIFLAGVAVIIYLAASGKLKFKRKKKAPQAEVYKIIKIQYTGVKKYILDRMNAERVKENERLQKLIYNGLLKKEDVQFLKPLVADSFTSMLALRRCNEMIELRKLSHKEAADEFEAMYGLGADTTGENIGYVRQNKKELLVKMWIESPGHYKNIINPEFDWCGIAEVEDENGLMWYCVLFGNEDTI